MPVRAIAYLRVSTDDQLLGPEAQRRAIEVWAAREGVRIAAWHTDAGVSGAAPIDRRPALSAALAELERGSVLVAAKRDRLARDVVAAALIERVAARAGATVATADGVGAGDGPEAALLRTLVDAFAAYERQLISARTRAALQAKRARGERAGTVPYGYRAGPGGRLEPEPAEQRAVRRARELAARGLGQRGIAEQLALEGHRPRGARWHRTTVRRILADAR